MDAGTGIRDRLSRGTKAAFGQSVARLQQASGAAVTVLLKVMTDGRSSLFPSRRALARLGTARLLLRYRESRQLVDRMPEARDRRLPVSEFLDRRDSGKSVPQLKEA